MSLGGDVVFEVVQPDYHEECGHYHYRSADCPEHVPCGSHLCCPWPRVTTDHKVICNGDPDCEI